MEENAVQRRIENIQTIFQHTQNTISENTDWDKLYAQLDSTEIEFRSIAYEAASMHFALLDLKEGTELKRWLQFNQGPAIPHAIQVHVGLGWALAQLQLAPEPFLSQLAPMLCYRVVDGYGYYEGTFRRRKSILSQQKPEFSDPVASNAYDQGLGRSFWYMAGGDISKVLTTLGSFPAERQGNLWRGVGIACAYVGGCTESQLSEILQLAGEYKPQLATGAVMATVSRSLAGYMPPAIELICKAWCKQKAEMLVIHHNPNNYKSEHIEGSVYTHWISGMENTFKQALFA